MLLTKEVEVKLWGVNVKYYNNLGYEGKQGDIITVKIEDLQHGSGVKVDVLCDYCQAEILHITYDAYNNRMNKSETRKCACVRCGQIKAKETNKIRWGCENPFQNEEIKAKCRQTNLERFKVEHPLQSKEIQDKMQSTVFQRFGVKNASQSEIIKQKKIDSYYKHFGVSHPMHVDNIKEKQAKGMDGKIRTSKQQRYLHKLYGGELNYKIGYFFADICLPDEKIVIEYNGGGHDLNVKTGKMTQEEYEQREIVRENIIKRQGYRTITIISSKDLLPSDTILLQMLNESRTYFNSTQHTWIEYNIDNSTIRNAEHKTGTPYDFGELRQVKEAS